MDWISLDQCQTSALCERFDDALEKECGHCSYCETRTPVKVASATPVFIPPEKLHAALALQQSMPGNLLAPVDITRVLCGIASPAISKAKLTRHELFGACAQIAFATVLEQVNSMIKADR